MLWRGRSSRLWRKAEKRKSLALLYQLVFFFFFFCHITNHPKAQWFQTGNIYCRLLPNQSSGRTANWWLVLGWLRQVIRHWRVGVHHSGTGWGWLHSSVCGGLAVPGQWVDWAIHLLAVPGQWVDSAIHLLLPSLLAWASTHDTADFRVSRSAQNPRRRRMGPPALLHIGQSKSQGQVKFKKWGVNSTSLQEELWHPVCCTRHRSREGWKIVPLSAVKAPYLPCKGLVKVLCPFFRAPFYLLDGMLPDRLDVDSVECTKLELWLPMQALW